MDPKSFTFEDICLNELSIVLISRFHWFSHWTLLLNTCIHYYFSFYTIVFLAYTSLMHCILYCIFDGSQRYTVFLHNPKMQGLIFLDIPLFSTCMLSSIIYDCYSVIMDIVRVMWFVVGSRWLADFILGQWLPMTSEDLIFFNFFFFLVEVICCM